MRPSGSPEVLEQRRWRAIALLQEGYQPVEIARRIGVSRRSVRRWKSAFLREGNEAIRAKPAPGRPARLDPRAKKTLETALLRGARAAGYSTDLWTCLRVAQVIHKTFGVRYHVDHIGRLLHALGWSPQKPQRRALERDEAAIQRWIKTTWPKVKKRLAARHHGHALQRKQPLLRSFIKHTPLFLCLKLATTYAGINTQNHS